MKWTNFRTPDFQEVLNQEELNQEETEIANRPVISKKIEKIIKTLPKKKN